VSEPALQESAAPAIAPLLYRHQGPGHRLVALEIFSELGWKVSGANDWDILWDTGVPGMAFFKTLNGRLYNHLPGMDWLGHKDGLARTLSAARERLAPRGLGQLYDFHPRTFLLPAQHAEFQEAVVKEPLKVWIKKPQAMSRGRGIELVLAPHKLGPEKDMLVQEYLAEPHLIDGYKYTLRCYLLITSVDPLCAFLFDEGFCKFTSRPFSLAPEHRSDVFRHLTNPDILRNDKTMPVSSRNLTHQGYRERLRQEGIDDADVFLRLQRSIALALLAARESLRASLAKSGVQQGCYDVLGVDMTLDAKLKTWMVECNLSPSLTVEAAEDSQSSRDEGAVKRRLIREMMVVLGAGGSGPRCGAGLPAVRAQLKRARHTGFRPVFPGPDALELLPLLERASHVEVSLAREAAGGGHRFRPLRSRAWALDDSLLVQSAAQTAPQPLEGVEPFVWCSLDDGRTPEEAVAELHYALAEGSAPAAEQVLAALGRFLTEGLVEAAPEEAAHPAANGAPAAPKSNGAAAAPASNGADAGSITNGAAFDNRDLSKDVLPPTRPALSWNELFHLELDGLRVALRLSPAAAALVQPTLRSLRRPPPEQADLTVDVEREAARFRIRDSAGADERVAPDALPARLHTLLLKRAARARRAIGPLDALLGDGPRPLLVLGAPGDWLPALAGSFSVLSQLPLLIAGSPLTALLERDPRSPAVTPGVLVLLRRDLDGEPVSAPASRALALERLLAAAVDGPPELELDATDSLLGWLQQIPCLELRARDPHGAAGLLRAVLR
jgi:Tubulin-tyrosine ligase family